MSHGIDTRAINIALDIEKERAKELRNGGNCGVVGLGQGSLYTCKLKIKVFDT